jgi:hypothetical protein
MRLRTSQTSASKRKWKTSDRAGKERGGEWKTGDRAGRERGAEEWKTGDTRA